MQSPPQVPHGSGLEVWHGFAVSTILATLAAIRLWLNRKKPDAEIHETESRTERNFAESRRIDADANRSLGEVFVAMSKQLSDAQRDIAEQRNADAKQIAFLQGEVTRTAESEEVARVRSHLAVAEVQRCVMRIRDYEELMKENNVKFQTFEFKSYEDIMREK